MDQKRTCLSINARNRDRISSLPDCLLHQILSFLDTKDAVLTGILSSRWETLWITNPNLSFCYKFDEYVDINKTPVPQYNQLYDLKKEGFSNSVRKVLDAQKGYETKKVVIDCDMMLESKLINSVMAYAISHNAREIEIMFDCQEDRIEFPESMYTSRSLEKLKLMGDQYDLLYVTKSMGFQYLKELTLHRVDFSQRGFNEEIFPDCLSLEFLRLFACDIDGPVKISAPKVKKLEIVYPLNEKRFDRPSFQICTPMLSYFKYEGPYPLYFTMVDDCTSCLEEIDIDVQADLSKEGDVRTKYIVERLIEMFRECSNAKSVIISLKTLEILSTLPSLLKGQKSPFANLKNVHLKTNWSGLAPGWSFLLNKSPTVKISLQGALNMVDVRRSSGNSS